jgi:hypothetical protein
LTAYHLAASFERMFTLIFTFAFICLLILVVTIWSDHEQSRTGRKMQQAEQKLGHEKTFQALSCSEAAPRVKDVNSVSAGSRRGRKAPCGSQSLFAGYRLAEMVELVVQGERRLSRLD